MMLIDAQSACPTRVGEEARAREEAEEKENNQWIREAIRDQRYQTGQKAIIRALYS